MRTENYIKNPLIDIEIREKRASLVQEMKDYLEKHEADEFKYYGFIIDLKFIIEELEDLREKELEIISNNNGQPSENEG